MIRVDLDVAVREYEETVGTFDPPAQELDEVERCFICPLCVLEDEDGGA